MGEDHIRYFLFLYGRWRWRPTRRMRQAGFELISMGKGHLVDGRHVPDPDDKARAIALNAQWDRWRRGLPEPDTTLTKYPAGSVGHAYQRVMKLREAARKAKGIEWTKEQHSRDDWPRAWKWIGPLFGDCDPKTVTPEQLIGDDARGIIGLRPLVVQKVSESEAHRVIKVWRALWKRMANFGMCELDRDPSLQFANSAPDPRQEIWLEGEAVRLVKAAWRNRYYGLAALLAVAWDSQLSPVDARALRANQMRSDPLGMWFETGRTKTGRKALATLSPRTQRLLTAYLAQLAAEPVGLAPIFRNRSGQPYSKDTLGDDFRAVRTILFGESETRWLSDFRRSGAVEALAGKVDPAHLSSKMANTISKSNQLHETYGPVVLAAVRDADAARQVGRSKLREQIPTKSVMAPDRKYHKPVQKNAKPLK